MPVALGVGVIGLGWVAGEHVRAYQANPRTRVVAVAGRSSACGTASTTTGSG